MWTLFKASSRRSLRSSVNKRRRKLPANVVVPAGPVNALKMVRFRPSRGAPANVLRSALSTSLSISLSTTQGGNRAMTQRTRIILLIGVFLAVLAAVLGMAPIPQSPAYHDFADTRPWWGIPNFANVISNAGFLIVGVLGLARIFGPGGAGLFAEPGDRLPYVIFFASLALIALGSGYYHWAPDTGTLFWDRLPMTAGFMSLFAAIIADRIDRDAGLKWLLPALLLAGVVSLLYWRQGEAAGVGDLRFYFMVQFFPLLAIPLILWLFPGHRITRGREMAWALAWYAAAKGPEFLDSEIFALTGGTIGGHGIKHAMAAVATYFVVRMIGKAGGVKTPPS